MPGETYLTVIGNLTGAAELRFTPNGAAVASFTIASTPKRFNRETQQWEDGETLFMRCSLWREAAENVAESLQRGTRVIAHGQIVTRTFETREGEKRSVMEMRVDEVGPSLKYATAKVTKNPPKGQGGGLNGNTGQHNPNRAPGDQNNADPWATPDPNAGQGNDWGNPEPPF